MNHVSGIVAELARRLAPHAPEPYRAELLQIAEESNAETRSEMVQTQQPAMPAQRVRPVFCDEGFGPAGAVHGLAKNGRAAGDAGHSGDGGAGKGDVRGEQ